MLGGKALRQIGIPQVTIHKRDVIEGRTPNLNVGELAETEAEEMIAGLNKTIVTGVVLAGLAWYFFLKG